MPETKPAPIIDGFTYGLPYWSRGIEYNYYRAAVNALRPLREIQHMYRPRWYVFPEDFTTEIDARQTRFWDVQLLPGSWLWAVQIGTSQLGPTGRPSVFLIAVREIGTGIELYKYPVNGYSAGSQPANDDLIGTWECPIGVLPSALPIVTPGMVRVQITNTSLTTAFPVQFMLCVMEPKDEYCASS